MLVFFCISFLIYGAVSLHFYSNPSMDPLLVKTPKPSSAPLVLAGLFFFYGVVGLITKRSMAGRVFSGMVVVESSVMAFWKLFLNDVAPQTARLSSAIEGFSCFAIMVALIWATRKGASIWR